MEGHTFTQKKYFKNYYVEYTFYEGKIVKQPLQDLD